MNRLDQSSLHPLIKHLETGMYRPRLELGPPRREANNLLKSLLAAPVDVFIFIMNIHSPGIVQARHVWARAQSQASVAGGVYSIKELASQILF
jgi:hypothetical protein